jgi:exodeoxyribonuclease-3
LAFSVSTWNINSVRLQAAAGAAFSSNGEQPDVLCLQETKCPDDAFPIGRLP